MKSLGDILVAHNVLTAEQLADITRKAEAAGVPLATYLRTEHIVSSNDLAKGFAEQLNLPYIDTITEKDADPKVLGRIPFNFLRDNTVVPIKRDSTIYLLTSDPQNFQAIDEVRMMFPERLRLAMASDKTIIEGINRFYPLEGTKEMIEDLEEEEVKEGDLEFGEIEETDILGMAQEAPIIKLVNHILLQAVKRDASDIHIEPYEKEIIVRYRIDGVMHVAFTPPKRVQGALVSRIKIMANLNIAEKRKPQDGRIQIKVADKAIDIRVSILPVSYGERIVMRLLDKSKTFGNLNKLGFSEHDYNIIVRSIDRPNGIVLLTGPTGSGKTSTLYSILSRLNKPEVNIITVEDPVEYQMQGIAQVQVNAKVGLTFAAALRSILRQDPDIIMIGETRDVETAQIAIQSSLTGHLVLSTLHTNSAPGSITRLIDMGIEPFLIASSLTCVIAQRLVRKLCDKCKEQYNPPEDIIANLGITAEEASKITFYKPGSCPDCSSGYKGRIAIFEVMPMSGEIARLTMERSDTNIIKNAAVEEGMTTLLQDGIEKIREGITSVEEVLSVAAAEQEIEDPEPDSATKPEEEEAEPAEEPPE